MFWIKSDDLPITGTILGLPRVLVVTFWLVPLIIAIWALLDRDQTRAPRETFCVYLLHDGSTWRVAPVGQGIPRDPLLDSLEASGAIRCNIDAENSRVLGYRSHVFVYRGTARITIEPVGARYTPEFCGSVVEASLSDLAAQADSTWPRRSLAPLIRSAGKPRLVVIWTTVAAHLLSIVMLIGAFVLSYGGRRRLRTTQCSA